MSNKRSTDAALVAVVLAGLLTITATALAALPVSLERDVASVVTARTLTGVESFAVFCDTVTPTKVHTADMDGFSSVRCKNTTATAVWFGASDVASHTGYHICASASCGFEVSIGMETSPGELYCKSDGASAVDVRCIAGR